MRALILIAGAALAVSGCSNDDQTGNAQNIDANLTAENITSNDVTAIDAVTAADANMAADVNYTDILDNELGNTPQNSAAPGKRPVRPARPARAAPKPVTASPADNTSSNSAE